MRMYEGDELRQKYEKEREFIEVPDGASILIASTAFSGNVRWTRLEVKAHQTQN